MSRISWVLLMLCATIVVSSGNAASEQKSEPNATVQTLLKGVERLSAAKDNKAEEARIAADISGNFDLGAICKACLGKTWDGLSEQERKNFIALFREILEKVAYPKSSDFFKGAQVEVEAVSKEAAKAQVDTVFEHPDEGLVEIGYTLEDVQGKWLIEDIQLDGVSLRVDLRTKMQKILREDSYEELKKRMREKLEKG